MSQPKFKGTDGNQEIDSRTIRPDTRRFTKKASEFFGTTDGVVAMMMALPIFALFMVKVPFSGELMIVVMWMFYSIFVDPGHTDPERKGGKIRKYDFPFRVPFIAKRFDGSMSGTRLGNGITFLGKEISTKLEIWTGDSDLRTHMLCLGTTGSGKTEFLLGLVYNALVQNSGFIYTDGKGAVDLFNNVFRLARYLGREDDLVTINFLTSGRDFLDKQKDRTTNTMNPFALGSSGMLIELIIALMDDSGGGGDMWKGRAIAFVAGLTRTLCYLRDKGYLLLDAGKFMEYFELPVIEKLVWDKTITENNQDIKIEDAIFDKVLAPLKTFILTLPGYKRESKGNQEQKTTEQHGFITMQLTRLFGDLGYTYGYIFQTTLGEVDMYDVVINRRILVVLLPSLERAPDSLKMLGKLIVGSIKQMMAGCLGNRLEGSVREIVMARPTNAAVPFYVVLDEYGYYAVLGFAVAPAQARSLGFPQPLYALVRMADGTIRCMGDVHVGDWVRLPNGGVAQVQELKKTGLLPVSSVTLINGDEVPAANVHHWPARVGGVQTRILTTLEIAEIAEKGGFVELSRIVDGKLEWIAVDCVRWVGIEETQCLVVADELHCYLTDHDVVTHNCITFAAQDFSSLQKASKEEADATWENTNVRIAGRMTGGKGAETFKRLADVTGSAAVYESGSRDFEGGAVIEGYRTVRDATVKTVDRLEFGDLAAQENGEFTILVGKKQKDGSGGVRIIRARTFFTQVKEAPKDIRVNHFIKIEPPRAGGDKDYQVIEALEAAMSKMLTSGELKRIFPDDPLVMVRNQSNASKSPLYQIGAYIREFRASQKISLGEAIRATLVALDKEREIQQAEGLRRIQADKQRVATEVDTALTQSVSTVVSSSQSALVDAVGEFEIPDIPEPLAFGVSEDGMPKSDLVIPPSKKEGEGEKSGGSGSSGSSSGGLALDLAPMDIPDIPDVPEVPAVNVIPPTSRIDRDDSGGGEFDLPDLAELPDIPEIPDVIVTPVEQAVKSVSAAIRNFIDADEFELPDIPSEVAVISAAPELPAQLVSPLTFRALNVDSGNDEITSQSAYLQERISEADLMLGVKTDVLEIKSDAQNAVKALEKATAYVNIATPAPATLSGVDSNIQALLYAAEFGSNDFS